MNKKAMWDKFNGGDPDNLQIDVRPSMSRSKVYPAKDNTPATGSVKINQKFSTLGADTVELLMCGVAGTPTLTFAFYAGAYQVGSDVVVTLTAGTVSKQTSSAIAFTDLIHCDSVLVTGTVTGGAYELWLGKQGVS